MQTGLIAPLDCFRGARLCIDADRLVARLLDIDRLQCKCPVAWLHDHLCARRVLPDKRVSSPYHTP